MVTVGKFPVSRVDQETACLSSPITLLSPILGHTPTIPSAFSSVTTQRNTISNTSSLILPENTTSAQSSLFALPATPTVDNDTEPWMGPPALSLITSAVPQVLRW